MRMHLRCPGVVQHHCRLCGHVFCGACAPKVALPDLPTAVRACRACHARSSGIHEDGAGAELRDNHAQAAYTEWDQAPWHVKLCYPFTTLPCAPYGQMLVRVEEARGLMAADFGFGSAPSSDPYVVLRFGAGAKQQRATRVVPRSLNPRWMETFAFDVRMPASTLSFDVFDADAVGRHDALGSVSVPLAWLRDGKTHRVWLALQPPAAAAQVQQQQKQLASMARALPGDADANAAPTPSGAARTAAGHGELLVTARLSCSRVRSASRARRPLLCAG